MPNLTNRQRRFVEFYLQTWNAAEACRQAGYKGRADVTGCRMMKKPWIVEAIRVRMEELQLKTDDVLTRLADQATANYADFFIFEPGDDGKLEIAGVNWEVFKARGHLVRKLSNTRYGPAIEFVDQQTALIQIGKALGVLTERVEQTTHNEQVEVHLYMPDNERDSND